LLLAYWPIHSVPTGYGGVVTTFGKISSVEPDGPAWVWPWQKMNIFNLRAEEANIPRADGSTSDTQPVAVSLTVRYSIVPDRVAVVFEKYSRTGDLQSYVQSASQEIFKAVTASFTATDLIAKRSQVSAAVFAALNKKISVYGAQVVSVDMTQFSFSSDYMAAINDKVTQEQKRMAAENKLKTVESEQKQKVAVAEAEAIAAKATADGKAYATLKLATAEADALKIQSQALAQNKEVLELRRIEVEQTKASRWDGVLPTSVYGSAPIPFLNTK